VTVSPIFWQRNRTSVARRAPLQSPGGLWTLYQSALGQVSMLLTALGRHGTSIRWPGAELGLGVRWRLVLTSIGVPGPSLGNPPVVVFSLGLGGVPEGGPVAGQHSGTPCAGTREMGQCDRPLEPKTGTRNVRWVSNGSRACMRGLRGQNEVPSAGGQCLVQLVVGAYWSSPAGYSGRPGPGPALVVCGCVGA
jgi:hypothetical protein